MTFVHSLLLFGLLLVSIPVLLHLIMRQKPKHLLFPAFRFLLQKHRTNQRKLRLRHLLLLALRMLLVAAICLALARPKIFNERLNLTSGQPVAAVLVIDTSASMDYRLLAKGGPDEAKPLPRSRLDEAKRRALELLDGLPANSRLAVLDTAELGSSQWLDTPEAVREKITQLKIQSGNHPVTSQLVEAYRLLARADDTADAREGMPRFLYIFSDRTEACWDPSRLKELEKLRDSVTPAVQGVFVDVGVDRPADLAILNLDLPRQAVPANMPVRIRVNLQATGADYDTQVSCRIDGQNLLDPKPVKLAAANSEQSVLDSVTFEFLGLKEGLHQVEVTLATNDNLTFNDRAFGTFEVRGPRQVLVLSDEPGDEKDSDDRSAWKNPGDAAVWKLALMSGEEPFQCKVLPVKEAVQLDLQKDLAPYQVICLLNVAQPTNDLWQKLQRYVESGGGLAVIPGGEDTKVEWYNEDKLPPADRAAQNILPGRLVKVIRTKPGTRVSWDERSYRPPVLGWFQDWARNPSIGFLRIPPTVTRYWEVQPATEDNICVRYADAERNPALLERAVHRQKSRGRVLLFTVPLDDRHSTDEDRWHDYLQGDVPFYVSLAKKTVGYLAGDSEDIRLNYQAGQKVTVTLPPAPRFPTYVLQGPGVSGTEAIVKRGDEQSDLALPQAVEPGNFTLVAGDKPWTAGFSLNVASAESQLARVPPEQIDELLGPGAVLQVAPTEGLRDALQGRWKQPLDLLQALMILVLVLLLAESVLANKFYRREPSDPQEAAT